MGLVMAARRYDADRGDFAAFASVTISGELKKYFRDHAWMVRPPRSIQEVKPQLASFHDERVTAENVRELATRHDVKKADITDALTSSSCYSAESLDACPPGSDRPWTEMIGDGSNEAERSIDHLDLRHALSTLNTDDRQLLKLRFVHQLTQQQIAARRDMSQMQVCRQLQRLMRRLRGLLIADDDPVAA